MNAAKLTGQLPGSMAADTTKIDQSIATLGLHIGVADNKVSYNLPTAFIDTFEGDDGIFGGALRSRGYRGYKNASTTDGGAGFILYSGSIDTSGDFGSDGEYTGGVGFELHGGHN